MLYFALAHRENVSANLEECSCNPWEKITTQFIIFLFVFLGKSVVRTKSFRFFSPRSRKRKSDDSVKVIACVLILILKSSSSSSSSLVVV